MAPLLVTFRVLTLSLLSGKIVIPFGKAKQTDIGVRHVARMQEEGRKLGDPVLLVVS